MMEPPWVREQGARSREQGAGSREHGAGSREQGAGSREKSVKRPALQRQFLLPDANATWCDVPKVLLSECHFE